MSDATGYFKHQLSTTACLNHINLKIGKLLYDINNSLAGKQLSFNIEVLRIRGAPFEVLIDERITVRALFKPIGLI